jgi:putative MATE family efflux protein
VNTNKGFSNKEILALALPIIIGGLAQNVILATDVYFMSGVNELALDAVGLAGLYFSTFYTLGLGFSVGVQIIIARRHGEGNISAIGTTFTQSLFFLIGFSIFLWLLIVGTGPLILGPMIHNSVIELQALHYLDHRAWGILFAFINLGFRAFYIGVSKPNVTLWALFLTAGANVFLNDVLIFGKLGFEPLGIKGAAVASSLAELGGTLVFTLAIFYQGFAKKFGMFQRWLPSKKLLKPIFSTSLPVMLQYFVSHLGWFLFFIIIEQNGPRALAISIVIRMVYMFQMVPFWGFGSATNTMVSRLIGEGLSTSVLPVLKRISLFAMLASVPLIMLNMIFPEALMSLALNKNDTNLIAECIPTLYVVSSALLFFAIGSVWFSGVSGSGNTKVTLIIEVLTIAFYCAVAWFLGVFLKADVAVIWLTEPLYFLVLTLASLRYMYSRRWEGKTI